MDVFGARQLVADYREFTGSFVTIHDRGQRRQPRWPPSGWEGTVEWRRGRTREGNGKQLKLTELIDYLDSR